MSVAARLLALVLLLGMTAGVFLAQDEVFVCPMDPDVRSSKEGSCVRCGMKLVSGIPDPTEYLMDLTVNPPAPKPMQPVMFDFAIRDPWKNNIVTNFQIVHERLFHMFVVSQDLKYFLHDHPTKQDDGTFRYKAALPFPGMYRVLGDFYPDGSTPQLVTKTVFVPGTAPAPLSLTKDYSTKVDANLQVELVTDPPQPIAHTKTMMFFRVKPKDPNDKDLGLEKLLGAWGHMLAASDDLIDMIHTHPFLADGGENIQFNVIFPRTRTYRVWVQFQRKGVENTVYFDVPVEELH
ncbi:MAG: heavy metal-binding domain-containing protein [Bryobacteraceae bacterium]